MNWKLVVGPIMLLSLLVAFLVYYTVLIGGFVSLGISVITIIAAFLFAQGLGDYLDKE